MAYLVDKESGRYWMYYGKGTTSDVTKAYRYTDGVALALLRLFSDTTYVMKVGEDGKFQRIDHKSPNSPLRNSNMIKHDLVWVGCEGVWLACGRQDLAVATLRAYGLPAVAA